MTEAAPALTAPVADRATVIICNAYWLSSRSDHIMISHHNSPRKLNPCPRELTLTTDIDFCRAPLQPRAAFLRNSPMEQQMDHQSPDAAALRTAGEASTSAAGSSSGGSTSSKDKPIVVLIIGESQPCSHGLPLLKPAATVLAACSSCLTIHSCLLV
jgi:hypothetical protein